MQRKRAIIVTYEDRTHQVRSTGNTESGKIKEHRRGEERREEERIKYLKEKAVAMG